MIYVSTSKLNDILEKGMKNTRFNIKQIKIDTSFLEVSLIPNRQNKIQNAIKFLTKEKLYFETYEFFRPKCYYKIKGKMIYKKLKKGINRINSDSIKINDTMFFPDDKLIFEILLNEDYSLRKIEIECDVQNIRCFSSQEVRQYEIFSPNTSDPGILYLPLLVECVIELRQIKDGSNSGIGSPLYIYLVRN